MYFKVGFLFVILLVGSYAEDDMGIYFDHTDTTSRIVGGNLAGRVPHMVALTYGGNMRNLFCGGSLISINYVLTAAHCLAAVQDGDEILSSVRGQLGTNQYARGGTTVTFSGGTIHPDYDRATIKNDVAVMKMSSDIELSEAIFVIALAARFIGPGVNTTVHGWGRIIAGGPVSEDLLELNATVVDGEECQAAVVNRSMELGRRPIPVNPEIEICTYTYERTGTCNGDSGSALLDSSTDEQIGVVSWGIPCALNAPDMFARISAFYDWIASIVPDIKD